LSFRVSNSPPRLELLLSAQENFCSSTSKIPRFFNPPFLLFPLLLSVFLSVSCATAPRAEEEEEEEEEEKDPMSSRFSSFSHQSGQQKSKKNIKTSSTLKDATFLTYNLTIMMKKKHLLLRRREAIPAPTNSRGERKATTRTTKKKHLWPGKALGDRQPSITSYCRTWGDLDGQMRTHEKTNKKFQNPRSQNHIPSSYVRSYSCDVDQLESTTAQPYLRTTEVQIRGPIRGAHRRSHPRCPSEVLAKVPS